MLHRFRRLAATSFVLLSPLSASAQEQHRYLLFLKERLGGTEAGIAQKLREDVIAAELPQKREGEIAVVGAVRIPVTMEFFLDSFRDIVRFKQNAAVLEIHKFGTPPSIRDVAGLALDQKERDVLAGCTPGSCGMKLSADMIRSMHGNIGDPDEKFRSILWSYLSGYLQKGTSAMPKYNDKGKVVDGGAEFQRIVSEFAWLREYAPPLVVALSGSYREDNNQVGEFLYWSREDLGLKPIVSVTHVFIYRTVFGGRNWAFLASKQIYADHYTDASLGLTVLVEESVDRSHPMLAVAYFNRSATDGLRGWLASLQRSIVDGRVRTAMRKNLSELKQRLTAAYQYRLPA